MTQALKLVDQAPMLNTEDLKDLYADLRYFGRKDIQNAAYNMFHRDETPLPCFWSDEQAFLEPYSVLHRLARNLKEEQFLALIAEHQIPEGIELNKKERELLHDVDELRSQTYYQYCFMESMALYLDYEIALIALGYPCEEPN